MQAYTEELNDNPYIKKFCDFFQSYKKSCKPQNNNPQIIIILRMFLYIQAEFITQNGQFIKNRPRYLEV